MPIIYALKILTNVRERKIIFMRFSVHTFPELFVTIPVSLEFEKSSTFIQILIRSIISIPIIRVGKGIVTSTEDQQLK